MYNYYSYEKKIKEEKEEIKKKRKEELIEMKRKSNIYLLKKSLYLFCVTPIKIE